jgi:hypothetical protein
MNPLRTMTLCYRRWPIAVPAVSRSPWPGLTLHVHLQRPLGQPPAVSIRSKRIGHSIGSYGYHSIERDSTADIALNCPRLM